MHKIIAKDKFVFTEALYFLVGSCQADTVFEFEILPAV